MKVSFLVTYYNQAGYVKESLESILSVHKPEDWEILVGDDGSQDDTVQRVQAYADQYPDHIRVFTMPREPGVQHDAVLRASANRLNLLRQATGDCFLVMDGDDCYTDRTFVTEAAAILEQHSGIAAVAFGYRKFREGTWEDVEMARAGAQGTLDLRDFIRNRYVHAGACVFRRSFFRDGIEKLTRCGYFDDNNIVLYALSSGGLWQVPRAVYGYRQSGQSVYGSMQACEQAVLNVQGLGADLYLTGEAQKRNLEARYAHPLVAAYLYRYRLTELLGADKVRRYAEGCGRTGFEKGVRLLTYHEQDQSARRDVSRWILGIAFRHPLRAGSAFVRTRLA